MDYKNALHSLIERIPDENVTGLKKLYEMAKKMVSCTRCAPTERPDRRKLANELRGMLIDIAIANRTDR